MDIKNGLTDKEVLSNKNKYGSNAITNTKKNSFISLLIESLGDPIIRILLIALGIKTIFLIKDFDWYETVGIVIAIFLASFISSISEYGSEKAFEKLQEESSKIKCRVRRNGKVVEINVDDVVVGDIVLLEAGERIPADGIIVEGEISVDESTLNGESKEKYKYPNHNSINDDHNTVYRGTVVYSKEAIMLVTKVGNETVYGKIAAELQEKQPESPLKIRLRKLAEIISKFGYIGAALVSISYLFSVIFINNGFNMTKVIETVTNFHVMFGYILYAMTLSVTIIVVAVPEGLPMMITLVLSSNMKRMLKDNILVRKLVGIETAGSLNILFTDKTGTLTKGKLEVVELLDGNMKSFRNDYDLLNYPKFYNLVKLSTVYNNASIYNREKDIITGGNITDRALLNFVKDEKNSNIKIIETTPFDSKNKYSKVTIDNGKKMTLIKGAPEVLINKCNSYYDEYLIKRDFKNKSVVLNKIMDMTKKGIRALVLATSTYEKNMDDLIFVGAVFIKDEVREDAIEGIKLVTKAGIQTVMITGDNKDTAIAIAKECGIINNINDIVLTSDELNKRTDAEIKQILPHLKVVARSLPQDKSRLVKISREMNLVVGMTGDGVNDAPALKKADVGFSMGSGTEVAKEASDIVILDDNFKSISKAILFGRTIFKSIRKFIIFQLTVNICAVSLSIIGPFIGVETPVTVIQMLWINMVMDTLAGLAFSYEAPRIDYMNELPKRKDEHIINKYMFNEILFTGLYSSIMFVLFLKLPIINKLYIDSNHLLTAFFALFIFTTILNSFNARTSRVNIFDNLFKNKVFIFIIIMVFIVQLYLIYYGGSLFRTSGLTMYELFITIIISFSVLIIDILRKIFCKIIKLESGF